MTYYKETPLIFNIQKFSTHDGPGIRTTVFFKGCPLKCLWCHNPESQTYENEIFRDENDFIAKQYCVDKLVSLIEQDHIFYDQSGGGVTLSGGEVMTQEMNYIKKLCEKLYNKGISIAVDTCGYAPKKNFEKIIDYVDIWLYDIKFFNSARHKEYTGVNNQLILNNLKYLSDNKKRLFLRLLLVEDVNDSLEVNARFFDWMNINGIQIEEVDLLPYHNFGRNKYEKLGRKCTQNFRIPTSEHIENIADMIEKKGFEVKIGG